MRKRLKVLTVGCKANFADSASIAGAAAASGFALVAEEEPADVVVVNSCTVTHRADRDSRSLARRARRENPKASIVLSGCYAELARDRRKALPEADYWVGAGRPAEMGELLRRLAGEGDPESRGPAPSARAAALMLGRQRTFLKIQDGCDNRCAYCVVPLARGSSRSVSAEDAVEAARRAEGEGAREIVLTGIHAGLYGAERGEPDGLARLLDRLLGATSVCRFRLGSIEPLEVTGPLLDTMAGSARVCPHLHVPLQSGSDAVLRRMRRPYTAARYLDAVSRAASRVPGIGIGADVIAGFPGETESDFAETLSLLARAPLHYLHAFSYSPREGTESASWPDDVPARGKKERVTRLRALDRQLRGTFLQRQVGATLEVLAERADETGTLSGYSGNYLPVALPGTAGEVGELHSVRIARAAGTRLFGTRSPAD